MEQAINDLEEQIRLLREVYEQNKKDAYEMQRHKEFNVGDWVTDGTNVGVVGWVENNSCDCPKEKGYMGVDLKNGRLGFLGFAKRDEWTLYDETFFTEKHKIAFFLTGAEIYQLRYDLGGRNINPSTVKSRILDLFDRIETDAKLCEREE